jgi:hypothetical protein
MNPLPKNLFSRPRFRPEVGGDNAAPFLPMSRAEMDALGWDSCDVILVTGDAYIDHPVWHGLDWPRTGTSGLPCRHHQPARLAFSRHSALQSRICISALLPAIWILWSIATLPTEKSARKMLTRPMANAANVRTALVVYAQRAREAFPDANVVIGSIEASLRRIAHYDYWSDKVRRSVLPDSKADILLFGNAERALIEMTHRLAAGEPIKEIRDLRGTAFMVPRGWLPDEEWVEIDSVKIDKPGKLKRTLIRTR